MSKSILEKKEIIGWTLFALLLLAIPISAWIKNAQKPQTLPVLAEVPPFQLINQEGKIFSRDDLSQNIWVANFIFTSCMATCPLLSQKMREIQDFIEKENLQSVKLLSITVDPKRDTPKRLKKYGQSYGARKNIWQFLTGDSETIQETVVKGFRMAMGKEQTSEDPNIFGIIHGERFLIIDENQKIRGFFDVTKENTQGFDFSFNHLFSSIKNLNHNLDLSKDSLNLSQNNPS